MCNQSTITMKFTLCICFAIIINFCNAQTTIFESSGGKSTGTYQEVINYYSILADSRSEIKMEEMGETDSGLPLHLVTVSTSGIFDFDQAHQQGKTVILINNGIHPGEPDGIEASMMLIRDYLNDASKKQLLDGIVIAIIPIYNIGGALNRNSHTRTNQAGPMEYGFRGNAQNLDLNRDFIKMDSRNAKSFAQIFQKVNPDIFIDTHVSNGADYQYNISHLTTQPDKLGGEIGTYLEGEMIPALEQGMKNRNEEVVPYVNVFNSTPDASGYVQFMDTPRFASGYAALFYSIGFTIETHMLKSFDTRVKATYTFFETIIDIANKDGRRIQTMRQKLLGQSIEKKLMPIEWRLDRSSSVDLNFKGYEGEQIKSKVTGQYRLYYNHDKPFTKPIPYYNHYAPRVQVIAPKAYIIPPGWNKTIERLKLNNVKMTQIKSDSIISVESYKILKYNPATTPYEGHYPHNNVEIQSETKTVKFLRGSYLIPIDQIAGRFLVEVLEPHATDSYFVWNFFDTILQQKEYFSPYVFEDLAIRLLEQDDELNKKFKEEKRNNAEFANNWYAQLDFIYKNSEQYEKSHMQYPVYRIID